MAKESAANKARKDNIFGKRQNVSKAERNEKKNRKSKQSPEGAAKSATTDLKARMEMVKNFSDEDYFSEEGDDKVESMELQHRQHAELNEDQEMRELLPIKTKEGLIARAEKVLKKAKVVAEPEEDDEEPLEIDEDADSDQDIVDALKADMSATSKGAVTTADLLAERQHVVDTLTYKIGVLCSGILEKPEEKIKNLTTLMHMVSETSPERRVNLPSIRKLAILSLVEIFKDIIPEYRVGIVDLEQQKVKKQTMQRVAYENALLNYYRKFLTKCEHMAAKIKLNSNKFSNERASAQEIAFAQLAIQAMCDLLSEHPYFNYGQNIAQFLVAFMDNYNEAIRMSVFRCFTGIFKTDKRMDLTQHVSFF